jgi:DNA-binding transcriptional regulator PaaX
VDFRKRYPIGLADAVATPMIVRESVKDHVTLPGATLSGLRQLAEYAGFQYGALRTMLTRLKQKGAIRAYREDGVTRFELCDFYNYVTRHYAFGRDEDGFTLAVHSGAGDSGAAATVRRRLQEILQAFGFRRLAAGTYISGRLDTSGLLAELDKASLGGRLHLFDCAPVHDAGMLKRIKGLWDLEAWTRKAEAFRKALDDFYRLDGLEDAELYNRIFYVGPAFYLYLQRDFPRLCSAHFPGRRSYDAIERIISETATRYGDRLTRYYLKIHT